MAFASAALAAPLCGCMSSAIIAPPDPPPQIHAPIVPPKGVIYTHFRAPLMLPDRIDLGKEGERNDKREYYIRIPTPWVPTEIALGRADIETAVREAGIDHIVWADYEFMSILVYFHTLRIHAYGHAHGSDEISSVTIERDLKL